jgi:hypothetical protein
MDPMNAYEVAKLRMAERHQAASRERQARLAKAAGSDDEQETSVWRRWTLRRVAGRITLAHAGS